MINLIENIFGRFLFNDRDMVSLSMSKNAFFWDAFLKPIFDEYINSNSICLEVGAHTGFHSVYMAKKAKLVYAFEPNLVSFFNCCSNVFLNQLTNVKIFDKALFDKNYKMSFTSESGFDPESNPYENIGLPTMPLRENDNGEIEAITIDSLNLSQLDFIECDAQGSDWYVLNGAKETITHCKPIITFEIENYHNNKLEKDYKELFKKLNYNMEQTWTINYIAKPN